MTHDEARDRLPLHVMGADAPAEREELLAHLAGCDECRRDLAEYQLAVTALGQAPPQVAPRRELRARTLAHVLGGSAPPSAVVLDRPAAAPSPVATPASGHWTSWLTIAAALVAAVSVAGLLQTRGELASLRVTLAEWQARVAETERRSDADRATLVAYQQQLDVMTADDVQLVSLDGVPPAGAAQARAFVSPSRRAVVFSARNLPALPAATIYQLWAIVDGQAVSAGLFAPDAAGRGQLVADVQGLNAQPSALAVTREPAGGVPAPTGPKILLGVPTN